MTRARTIHKINAPSYGAFYERARAAHGPVIRGAHLDIDPENPEALRDPFRMARRFAFLLAKETGQPFAWGWFNDPQHGRRPGVCSAEEATQHLHVAGATCERVNVTVNGTVEETPWTA